MADYLAAKRMLYFRYIPLAEHFFPYETGLHPKAMLEYVVNLEDAR
jgi:hypothetical protein